MGRTLDPGTIRRYLQDPSCFRDHAARVLRAAYPTLPLERLARPDRLRAGEVELDLSRLQALCTRGGDAVADTTPSAATEVEARGLGALLERERAQVLDGVDAVAGPVAPYEVAAPRLLPRLCPRHFLSGAPLARFPFHGWLDLVVALDADGAYVSRERFVRGDDLQGWGLRPDELLAVALENLDWRASGIPVLGTRGPERYLGLTADGAYDAARVLLPARPPASCLTIRPLAA